jgi:hypothetical protein
VPNTTIGGATALTADRADQLPVNRSGADGSVTAADIYRASSEYADIRDYGTVTDGGSITAALQATLDAIGTHRRQRIRVPKVGSGSYTCGAINFPSGSPIMLELDCTQISLSATWSIPSAYKIIGMRTSTSSFPHPYRSLPGVTITTSAGLDPILSIFNKEGCYLEGLRIVDGGTALVIEGGALHTIKNCTFGTNTGVLPALKIESCFWVQIENVSAQPGLTGGYSIEFTTDVNHNVNCGILLCKDLIVHRNGILFRSNFGPGGVNNTIIDTCHMENGVDGNSIFTFDSTNGLVGQIRLVRIERSDSGGVVYLLKNIGGNTSGIHVDANNQELLLDPTSDAIDSLVIENSCRAVTSSGMPLSLSKQFAGTEAWGSWSYQTPSSIDTKLITAPIGVPWMIHAPLPVVQDPASWTAVSGATITTGKTAPDGSTMAGEVTGGAGARCYSANHTLAVGDYIVAGVWMRHPSGGSITAAQTGIELIGAAATVFTMNDGGGGSITPFLEDGMSDNGWRWCCSAYKITAIGTNPCTVRFRFLAGGGGAIRQFFNPCMMLIPASSSYDESWLVNFARSTKGGWPAVATAGDVALLDHQKLRLGGGVRIFSSAAVPSTGTGEVGDISFNSAPSAGEPLGWVCVGAGSPGTWMGLATITDAAMRLVATGTGTGSFVGTTVAGTGQGALTATGTVTPTFVGTLATGAQLLLYLEADGFALDATTDGGTVAVVDTATPANDLSNVSLDASNLANTSTSTKTVLWDDGLLRTSGSGAIHQQYDTAASQFGILVEPAATNLVLRSQELDNASWTLVGATVTADAATAPDGASTADKLVESSGGTNHNIRQSVTITSGATYTYSVFVKKAERTGAGISFVDSGFTAGIFATLNLTLGTITSASSFGGATYISSSITAIGSSDWFRVTLTGSIATTSALVVAALHNPIGTDTYSGDGTSGAYFWGAQLETGALATSYITTTAATVTRAADVISVDTDTFPWSDTTGTIYLDYKPFNVAAGTRYGWSAYLDASNFISLAGITANPTMGNTTGGSADVATDLGTLVANTRTQITVGYGANDFDGSQDGAAATADSTATLTINYDPLYIGTTGVTGSELHGYIYRMIFVPRQVETDGNNIETWRHNF